MIERHPITVYAPEIPVNTDTAAGYFAAIRLDDFSVESLASTTIYSRKDFYKISLITGHASYHYRDHKYLFHSGEWALVFANRQSPYRWEIHDEGACSGYSCMFTEDFLPMHTHVRPADWTVFNDENQPVFRLGEDDKIFFESLFKKMMTEQASSYSRKYDLLFLYVLECIHGALKLKSEPEYQAKTAGSRLANAFKNLLAGQFPLVSPHQQLQLRTPQDFAEKLAVHTNHLNRVLKEITGSTTTQLINERVMQEARALLLHSNWAIGQISASLGFEEATHFTRAFKAHTGQKPSSLR